MLTPLHSLASLDAWPGLATTSLAWRPFLDPFDLHRQWFFLLVPLALGIAVTYRAVRVNTFEKYWIKTIILTVQIVLAMILLGAASYLFIQVAVPFLLPMPE
ncbi:MAG: hypothetical protein ACF8LK_07120 [Phycisphaerales bacterium JB041]